MWLYDSTDKTWHLWVGTVRPPDGTPAWCGHLMSPTVRPDGDPPAVRCEACRRAATGS